MYDCVKTSQFLHCGNSCNIVYMKSATQHSVIGTEDMDCAVGAEDMDFVEG